jgi:hypothetical protein
MFALKWLLMAAGIAMFGSTAEVVAYDVYLAMQFQKLMGSGEPGAAVQAGPRRPMRWPLAMKLFGWAWAPLLLALGMVFVPEGSGGVRIRQISGVQQGTLYPGIHLIVPLVQRVAVYDLRDHLFTTVAAPDAAAADSERLQLVAAVLKQNPMLIQKIIAERLSDKLQIIIVPTDGRNFFASDVLRSALAGIPAAGSTEEADQETPMPAREATQTAKIK